MKKVLIDYNQVANEKNINSFVSTLRRNLSIYINDIIIQTVPKEGFKFNAIVDEYKSDEYKSDEYKSDEYKSDEYKSDEYKSDEYKSDEYKSDEYKKSILIGIFSIALSAILTYFILFKVSDEIYDYPIIGNIGKCKIKFVDSYHNYNFYKLNISKLKESIVKNKINCNNEVDVYYYNTDAILDIEESKSNIISYSYCFYKDKSIFCGSIYEKEF